MERVGARRVIVADGDGEVRRLLHAKLRAAGFEVGEASSAQEVREVAQRHPPDVLVCEWRLADGDPGSLFGELATVLGPQQPVVVVLRELDGDGDIEEALLAGADDVAAKPFSPTELLLRIRVALVRRALAGDHPAARETGGGA
jgi:DNA-binding response OmpR family regulator